MQPQENKSEVARLMASIEAEYEAGKRGLEGLSEGSARHKFIREHIDRLWEHKEELSRQVGEEKATVMLCQVAFDEDTRTTSTTPTEHLQVLYDAVEVLHETDTPITTDNVAYLVEDFNIERDEVEHYVTSLLQ